MCVQHCLVKCRSIQLQCRAPQWRVMLSNDSAALQRSGVYFSSVQCSAVICDVHKFVSVCMMCVCKAVVHSATQRLPAATLWCALQRCIHITVKFLLRYINTTVAK